MDDECKRLIEDMWEEINPRRCELIELSVRGKPVPDELDELARLQNIADRVLSLLHPMPIAQLVIALEDAKKSEDKNMKGRSRFRADGTIDYGYLHSCGLVYKELK